jgi:putative transposase
MVFHVLNRGVGRMRLFAKVGDYEAFERVLAETLDLWPMRLCAYCVMPNHWHMVLWPREDGDLAAFMQRLTITHARRWQEHRHEVGTGHIYQGRYKSFPVQSDEHFLTVCRYVERNALRAGLVERAEEWRWCSLWRRGQSGEESAILLPQDRWPAKPPRDWARAVNRAETGAELDALRQCVIRGRPFGGAAWTGRTVGRLGLENTLRPRGRPRKQAKKNGTG